MLALTMHDAPQPNPNLLTLLKRHYCSSVTSFNGCKPDEEMQARVSRNTPPLTAGDKSMSIVQALVPLALALAWANAVVLKSSSPWVVEETFSFNERVSVLPLG